MRLTYDHHGKLLGQHSAARAVGTTVSIRDLFKTLPVRHKVRIQALRWVGMAAVASCSSHVWRAQEFKRNLKREFAKLLTIVQAYAIISTGVRIICTNQVLL